MLKKSKKDVHLLSILVFIFMSLFFLAGLVLLARGRSFFDGGELKIIMKDLAVPIVLFVGAFFVVYNFKRNAHYIILAFIFAIAIKSFGLLFVSFNKLILILDFAYLFFAFYFYTSWEIYLGLAAHNPRFASNDLEMTARFPIKGFLTRKNKEIYACRLTNIDEESGFILLEDEEKIHFLLGEDCHLQFEYENNKFQSEIKLCALFSRGLGFNVLEGNKSQRSLAGLSKVCLERGTI